MVLGQSPAKIDVSELKESQMDAQVPSEHIF